MSNEEMQHEGILYRTPTIEDGASIWQLARDLGTLDLNSTYCYLLLGKHFSETCAVAVKNGEIIGFVTGYLVPHRADTLFVWQIGITDTMRGQGLAIRLLQSLRGTMRRKTCFVSAHSRFSDIMNFSRRNHIMRIFEDLESKVRGYIRVFPAASDTAKCSYLFARMATRAALSRT